MTLLWHTDIVTLTDETHNYSFPPVATGGNKSLILIELYFKGDDAMDLCRHLYQDIRALLKILWSPNEFPHPNFNLQLRMAKIIYCTKRMLLIDAYK
jgi:hypothetical protein